jgi:hypothetical protein
MTMTEPNFETDEAPPPSPPSPLERMRAAGFSVTDIRAAAWASLVEPDKLTYVPGSWEGVLQRVDAEVRAGAVRPALGGPGVAGPQGIPAEWKSAEALVPMLEASGMGLEEIKALFKEGCAVIFQIAKERLRLIDLQSGQLKLLLDDEGRGVPKQHRADRAAEEQELHKFLASVGAVKMTLAAIAKETKLGQRALPTLKRLQAKELVTTEGNGRAAVWWALRGFIPTPVVNEEPPSLVRRRRAPAGAP